MFGLVFLYPTFFVKLCGIMLMKHMICDIMMENISK